MRKLCKNAAVIALLIAVLVGASACTTNNTGTPTTGPTVQPMPTATATAATTTTPTDAPSPSTEAATLTVNVEGKDITEKGVAKGSAAWLPLKSVAEALGYQVQESVTGTGDAKRTELTISPKANGEEPVKVAYQVKDNTVSEASVTRTGMTKTLSDPLMMAGTTLYAAEKVFTEALNARVVFDSAAGKVTVTMNPAP